MPKYAQVWPNITIKREPPPDAKDWEGKPDKAELLSPNPGSGDCAADRQLERWERHWLASGAQ